jgi:alginate O-acetyltransferase complex protein AlgI
MSFDLPSLVYFYSSHFMLFFVIVFSLYWLLSTRLQTYALLIASYTFYCSWDYRFLSLIIVSTLTDYYCGKKISQFIDTKKSKHFLYLSVFVNIGLLITFKYFNFFIDGFHSLTVLLNMEITKPTLRLVLPLGISFYTFQTLTYSIDIYRKKLKPENSLITFASFVSFFPQLIAGPIERASKLLPQIKAKKSFRDIPFEKASYLFAYGFFKKRVIADYMVVIVERAYENPSATGVEILIGLVAFVIQVYCDVSGYAHMARGLAYFLGIELSKNFNFPFFASNPSDFWNRWHMTLSSWVRDYVFMPLLIRNKRPFLNVFLVFFIMGAWHGIQMNFLIWGLFWSTIICIYHYIKRFDIIVKFFPKQARILGIACMFCTMFVGQSLNRAESLGHYYQLWLGIFSDFQPQSWSVSNYVPFIFSILFLAIYESILFFKGNQDEFFLLKSNFWIKMVFYMILIFSYRNVTGIAKTQFIYFNY